MRHLYGFLLSVIVGSLLTFTIVQTISTYNMHERLSLIAEEQGILDRITRSPLKKTEGDLFTFENGTIDFSRKTYNITGNATKFKTLNINIKSIKSVKFDTKTNTGKSEFEANRLYALTYRFKVKKDVYDRVKILYCTDSSHVR